MPNLEKLINDIMKEAERDGEPVTREEAREMAEMEIKARDIKRYEREAPPKAEKDKRRRTVKTSAEKIELFNTVLTNLDRCNGVLRENIEVLKENKLILVHIGNKKFKIDIIETKK